jgi:hypothetical protein
MLFKPFGAEGSFFFSCGLGPRYVVESSTVRRGYSYLIQSDGVKVGSQRIIPSASFGIGRMMKMGRSYATFEIRYSFGLNDPKRKVSLPVDNTQSVHGHTLMQCEGIF